MSYESYATYEPSPEDRRRIEEERLRALEEERQRVIAEARRQAASEEATRNAWVRDYDAVVARNREAAEKAARDHERLLAESRASRTAGKARPDGDVVARFEHVRGLLEAAPMSLPPAVHTRVARIRHLVERVTREGSPAASDHEPLAEAARYLAILPQSVERERSREREVDERVATIVAELTLALRLAEASALRQRAAALLSRVRTSPRRLSEDELRAVLAECQGVQVDLKNEQSRNAVREALVARLTTAFTALGFRVDPPPAAATSPTTVARHVEGPDGLSATMTVKSGKVANLHLDIGDASPGAPIAPGAYARQGRWCAAVDAVQRRLREEGFVVNELRRNALPAGTDRQAECFDAEMFEDEYTADRTPKARAMRTPE